MTSKTLATQSSPADSTRAPMVQVKDVSKRYGRTLALDSVSLDIGRNQRYAILGPNGAGKTTLIHALCTIHEVDSGTITVNSYDVKKQPRLARRHLGVVFQEPSLDTRLTVAENLEFHGLIYGVSAKTRRERSRDLLELVELTKWKDALVRSLSKGMQRRLEIARALVHDAKLLVLDEPTIGLDAQTRLNMWNYLTRLQQERELTILVTTHYIEEVEACDTVCVIDAGKVLAVGTPAELKSAHGETMVRVEAGDAESAASLQAAYPTAVKAGQDLLVPIHDEGEIERLLAAFGSRLRAFTVERPTLESAFLNLTGRTIRDSASDSARERLLQFARQGGEHTR